MLDRIYIVRYEFFNTLEDCPMWSQSDSGTELLTLEEAHRFAGKLFAENTYSGKGKDSRQQSFLDNSYIYILY